MRDATGPVAVPCMVVADASLVPHLQGLLEAAGIPHYVKHDGVQELVGLGSSGFGYNVVAGAPVVMVEPERLDEATALLEEFLESVRGPLPEAAGRTMPAACPRCRGLLEPGEGEAALTHCYHCGAALE